MFVKLARLVFDRDGSKSQGPGRAVCLLLSCHLSTVAKWAEATRTGYTGTMNWQWQSGRWAVPVQKICQETIIAGCVWWLVLVWCKRKILLAGWWSSQQNRVNRKSENMKNGHFLTLNLAVFSISSPKSTAFSIANWYWYDLIFCSFLLFFFLF